MKIINKKEHVFFISDPYNLKYFYSSKFDRIYFGNEFYEYYLPDSKQLKNIIDFCSKNYVSFSLVTPYNIDFNNKMIDIIKILPENTEIIINNFELLKSLEKFNIVLGRILSDTLNDKSLQYLIPGNIKNDFDKIIKNFNIRRMELDNKLENFQFNKKLNYSLYYPYIQTYLKNDKVEYYKNNRKPEEDIISNINRMVYMPIFPEKNTFNSNDFYLDWDIPYSKHYNNLEWDGNKYDDVFKNFLKKIKLIPDSKVFDIGCGNGRNYVLFNNKKIDYTGIDVSKKAISICKEKIKFGKFYNKSILDFDKYKNHFDLIIDYGCFHAIPSYNQKLYVEKITKLLKIEGYYFLGVWENKNSNLPVYYSYDQLPEWGFNYKFINELFHNSFLIIDYYKKKMDNDNDFIYFLMKKKA